MSLGLIKSSLVYETLKREFGGQIFRKYCVHGKGIVIPEKFHVEIIVSEDTFLKFPDKSGL